MCVCVCVCEQLAQSRYLAAVQPGIELATSRSLVRRPNRYTTKQHSNKLSILWLHQLVFRIRELRSVWPLTQSEIIMTNTALQGVRPSPNFMTLCPMRHTICISLKRIIINIYRDWKHSSIKWKLISNKCVVIRTRNMLHGVAAATQ